MELGVQTFGGKGSRGKRKRKRKIVYDEMSTISSVFPICQT